MATVTVGSLSFQVESADGGVLIDGKPFPLDVVKLRDNYYSILYQNRSFVAEVLKVDRHSKTFLIRVNRSRYEVSVKDKFDLLLEKMGMSSMNSGHFTAVRAPMPGLIVDMKIKEGDRVRTNDPLLVLEAMKMENVIKSPGEGIVKSILVNRGESVEKNQILVEF